MDLTQIFKSDELLNFWPSSRQSAQERANATARFVIYATVIIYLINNDPRIFALGILVLGVLYYMYTSNMIKDSTVRPAIGDARAPGPFREAAVMPTYDNPMGNVLMTDYIDQPDRPSAAWYPSVRQEVAVEWAKIHPFERQRDAERNFYTAPVSTIPNDQNAFAQASYGKKFAPLCKDQGGDACDPDRPYSSIPERPQMRAGNGR